ncbi:hypothetical protein GQ55_5G122100 [Panicum hallii var. hallii]|uniref:Uncharacterized protein n=1 Tax=Panicum hallii var. hallii TaxID=1504633 RepID=A0A2T7DFJ6_9POAL|nr:hypothetical protein GQ55_5G122100 [Panicum hallii var. hallii]
MHREVIFFPVRQGNAGGRRMESERLARAPGAARWREPALACPVADGAVAITGRPRGELAHDHPARARQEPNRQLIALTLSQSLGPARRRRRRKPVRPLREEAHRFSRRFRLLLVCSVLGPPSSRYVFDGARPQGVRGNVQAAASTCRRWRMHSAWPLRRS